MYVIGDSHARSFSYHEFFVPLFVGPGKETLFLTDKQTEKTRLKILENIKLLDKKQDFLFILSEPNIRYHLENKYNTKLVNDDQTIIRKTVANYIRVLKEVLSCIFGNVFVLCAIPRDDVGYSRLAKIYNEELKLAAKNTRITYVDLWKVLTTKNGTIKPKYIGDYIHANHLLADMVVKYLKQHRLVSKEVKIVSKYGWEHAHYINVAGNETRIWGDFNKKELVFKRNSQRDWGKCHIKTKIIDTFLKIINTFLVFKFKNKSVCVISAKEGYVPFRLRVNNATCVYALESNVIKRNMANCIKGLYKAGNVNFLSKEEAEDVRFNKKYSIVICLEDISEVLAEWDELFYEIVQNSECAFLLSRKNNQYLKQLGNMSMSSSYFHPLKMPNNSQAYWLHFLQKKENIFYQIIFMLIGKMYKNFMFVEFRRT